MQTSELLQRCADGNDCAAWNQLVACFGARMEQSVRRVLRDGGWRASGVEVEDLLQDVYCRLLAGDRRALRAFRGRTEREATAFLRRIAENVARDRLRQRRAEKRTLETGLLRLGAGSEAVLDPGPDPEELVLARERRRRFVRLLGSGTGGKPKRDAWILGRALLDGWTTQEIAAATGGRLRTGTINSLVSRARRRLAARGHRLPRRDRR